MCGGKFSRRADYFVEAVRIYRRNNRDRRSCWDFSRIRLQVIYQLICEKRSIPFIASVDAANEKYVLCTAPEVIRKDVASFYGLADRLLRLDRRNRRSRRGLRRVL